MSALSSSRYDGGIASITPIEDLYFSSRLAIDWNSFKKFCPESTFGFLATLLGAVADDVRLLVRRRLDPDGDDDNFASERAETSMLMSSNF